MRVHDYLSTFVHRVPLRHDHSMVELSLLATTTCHLLPFHFRFCLSPLDSQIGVDFGLKELHWENNTIRVQLWDIAGLELLVNYWIVHAFFAHEG